MSKAEELTVLIIESVREINELLDKEDLSNPSSDTRLYGSGGNLDSLSLVRLVADVEGKISDRFGINITLADERAVSQKRSPFRDIRSLAEYADKLLAEGN